MVITEIMEKITRADGSEVSLLFNSVENAQAQVIFAHGAGANMSHEFMCTMTQLLNDAQINVVRFNFSFMDKRALTGKKYPPDRMPKLLTCFHDVVEFVINQHEGTRLALFIGGKSMGSRVAATLVSDTEAISATLLNKVSGVFCIGYPFHPAKKPEKLRLEPLISSSKEILILQGDRDTLGDESEIASYNLPENCRCVFFEDGDHSLKPRVKSGFSQNQHMKKAVDELKAFIKAN